MNEDEEYYPDNDLAGIIKGLAILLSIIGIIVSIGIGIKIENYLIIIIGCTFSILSVLFIYAIGEALEILHDIRTNSEHIRDYLEKE